MSLSLEEYFEGKGSIGLLVVLASGKAMRFTDIADDLPNSTSTITERLSEARQLSLITTEVDEGETSINAPYRISERGRAIVRHMDEIGLLHAYRTYLNSIDDIEEGRNELQDWVDENKLELAMKSDLHWSRDRFGNDLTADFDEEDS